MGPCSKLHVVFFMILQPQLKNKVFLSLQIQIYDRKRREYQPYQFVKCWHFLFRQDPHFTGLNMETSMQDKASNDPAVKTCRGARRDAFKVGSAFPFALCL